MKKILVIEDEKEIREKVVLILTHEGYEAISAENGELGVKAAFSQNPDLILCDIMMPGMDGLEVFSNVNYIPAKSIVPFIFLTAKSDKSDIRKAMHLGAADYITKPFEVDDLLAAIKTQLAKREDIIQKLQDERIRLLAKLEDELRAKDIEIEKYKQLQEDSSTNQQLPQIEKSKKIQSKLNPNVLLIVNNRLMRLRLLSTVRKYFNCNLLEADNMHEAFLLSEDIPISYIILESSPPQLDPLLIIRQIKYKANLMHSPILISADNINKESITEFAKFGNIDFILNPFDPEKLAAKISKIIPIKEKE